MKKPNRMSVRDQIYMSLREGLMSGTFAPGQTLTILALAAEMETSAMPVREALRQLVAEGAVEIQQSRSVFVPVLSANDFDDLTNLRLHCEGLLAGRAARNFLPEQVKRLKKLDAEMSQCAGRRELDKYLQLNREFHFTIYRAAGSPIYLAKAESLWLRVGPLIRFALSDREFESSTDSHQTAISAFEEHDEAGAQRAIEKDIALAAVEIHEAFDFETGQLYPSKTAA